MDGYLLFGVGALTLLNCVLLVSLLGRGRASTTVSLDPISAQIEKLHERTEKLVRDEIAQNRAESATAARQNRDEFNLSMKSFGEAQIGQMGQIATMQKGQLDTFSNQLTGATQANEQKLEAVRLTLEAKLSRIAKEAAEHAAKGREEDNRNFDGFCQLLSDE